MPVGHAERRGVGARLHPRERDHADDGAPRASGWLPVPHDDVLLHLLHQHLRGHPGLPDAGQRAHRGAADPRGRRCGSSTTSSASSAQGFGPLHQELVRAAGRAEVRCCRSWCRSSSSRCSSCGPFSLAIRLFANMLAGHFILVTFALADRVAVERRPTSGRSCRSACSSRSPASRCSSPACRPSSSPSSPPCTSAGPCHPSTDQKATGGIPCSVFSCWQPSRPVSSRPV